LKKLPHICCKFFFFFYTAPKPNPLIITLFFEIKENKHSNWALQSIWPYNVASQKCNFKQNREKYIVGNCVNCIFKNYFLKLRIFKLLFLDLAIKPLIQKWTLRSLHFWTTMWLRWNVSLSLPPLWCEGVWCNVNTSMAMCVTHSQTLKATFLVGSLARWLSPINIDRY